MSQPTAPPTPAPSPVAERPRRGYPRTFAGMIGAMIAVLGLIAAMWLLSWVQHRPVADPARTVDYTPVLQVARSVAPFPVLAPDPVPAGLRATSVGWDPVGPVVSWHVGFVSSDKQYVGLYQGNGPTSRFIAASTPATKASGQSVIDGQTWHVLTDSGRGETALVRTSGGATTVVTGTVDLPTLRAFTAALTPNSR